MRSLRRRSKGSVRGQNRWLRERHARSLSSTSQGSGAGTPVSALSSGACRSAWTPPLWSLHQEAAVEQEAPVELGLGLLAGFFFGVAADIVRQWLGRKTRREERSEAAAHELIGLLDKARDPFRDAYQLDADVDRAQVREATSKLRQKALILLDSDAEPVSN